MAEDLPQIIIWLVIGAICIASIYFRNVRQISRNEVIRTLAEKGLPLPPELFKEARPWGRQTFIVAGVLLCGLGAAMLVFFLAFTSGYFGPTDAPKFLPFISAFPICIGIACFFAGHYLKSHD